MKPAKRVESAFKRSYYERVGRKRHGHTIGGQGRWKGPPLDPAEKGALKICSRIDAHVFRVDQMRINLWMRAVRKAVKVGAPRKARRLAKATAAQIAKDNQEDERNIRKAFCRKCGNHRVFNPDHGRKCRVCRQRRKATHTVKAKATGKWGAQKRLHKQRRRALKRANGGTGIVTQADWQWVLDKYGSACLCCGDPCGGKPTMDHVVPLSLGGPHDKTNLQPLCRMCNSIKCATVIDYRHDRPLAPMMRDPTVIKYVE